MSDEDVAYDWKSELPEELRDSPMIKEASSLEGLAKQALDYQRMSGNSIRIPGENASEEDVTAFRGKLSAVGMVPLDDFQKYVRPQEINQYKLEDPPSDVASIGLTQADVDAWKDAAYSDGLSQAQFQAVATRNIEQMRTRHTERSARYQANENALKDEWGAPGYEPNRQRALAAASRFGGEELVAALKANPDPTSLKAFAEIGKAFEEQGMGDLQQPLSLPETKDEASIKLAEIRGNKEHPFNKGPQTAGKAAYNAAHAEVMRLARLISGEGASTKRDSMFAN